MRNINILLTCLGIYAWVLLAAVQLCSNNYKPTKRHWYTSKILTVWCLLLKLMGYISVPKECEGGVAPKWETKTYENHQQTQRAVKKMGRVLFAIANLVN